MISKRPIYIIVLLFKCAFLFAQNDTLTNPSICGLNMSIADNSCNVLNDFYIDVSGYIGDTINANFKLQEVKLMIKHTWDSDLDIFLTSPQGSTIELSTHNGSIGNDYGEISDLLCGHPTVFSMNPCSELSIVNGTAPFIGEYMPEGNFNDFIGSAINGLWKLTVCDTDMDDFGTLEYVELVFGTSNCEKPIINTVSATTSEALVNMTFSNPSQNIIIEYGEGGFIPGTTNVANQGQVIIESFDSLINNTLLLNLTPNTFYDLYIRTECAPGIYSVNSCLYAFMTGCSVDIVTNITDFDSLAICVSSCGAACMINGTWFNNTDDDFDWTVSIGPTASSFTGPMDDVTMGGNYIYLETSGADCRNGNEAILQSNCMQINGGVDSCHMSFYYSMYGSNIAGLRLDVSLDQGGNWFQLWNDFGNKGEGWHKQYIDLSLFLNSFVQFRFVGLGGSGHRGDIGLDQIEFYGPIDLEESSFEYFVDNDGDGYGNAIQSIQSCSPYPPVGYTDNFDDCDDNNPSVHPLAPEIPCNGIDDNCDLMQDTTSLSGPIVTNDSICTGEMGQLVALPSISNNLVFWYATESGINPVFVGNNLPLLGQNTTDSIQRTTYFVEEQSSCSSPIRIPVYLDVYPNIFFNDIDTLNYCIGEEYILTLNSVLLEGVFQDVEIYSDPNYLNLYAGLNINSPFDTLLYFQTQSNLGCIERKSIHLINHELPEVHILNGDSLSLCYSDVQLLLAQATGQTPLSFTWNTGINGAVLPINGNGTGSLDQYIVNIEDAFGCTNTDTIIAHNLPNYDAVNIDSIVPLTNFNSGDGMIGISLVGGVSPFNVSWTGAEVGSLTSGNQQFVINNLDQGFYNFFIADANNCTFELPQIYVPSTGVFPVLDSIHHNSCFNANDGAIYLNISGGLAPYQILWSNDSTSYNINDLEPGFYNATITDANNEIVVFENIEIENPIPISYTLLKNDITCFDAQNGFILLTPIGGVPPYHHNWNNGLHTNILTDLEMGFLTDTIVDENNCFLISNEIFIGQPDSLSVSLSIDQISCFNSNDGKIELNVNGGTPPYLYQWNNNEFTSSIINLTEGDYYCTITDAKGCQYITPTIEMAAAQMLTYNTILHQPTCFNNNDGQIDLNVNGGYPPYSVIWNDTIDQQNLFNLVEGIYRFTILDDHNCYSLQDSVVLERAPYLSFDEVLTPPSCSGKNDGTISLNLYNEQGIVDVFVNGQSDSSFIGNITDSLYLISIVDETGCFYEKEINVNAVQDINILIDTINDVSCNGFSNGFILLSAFSASNAPLTYSWNGNNTSLDQFNLGAGNYDLRVMSNTGCIYDTTFLLSNPLPLTIIDTIIDDASCASLYDGGIELIVSGGMLPYNLFWSNGTQNDVLENVGKGFYSSSIFDANGCSISSGLIEISEPSPIVISDFTPGQLNCNNFAGNYSNINVVGGLPPYQYLWSNDSTTHNIQNVEAGIYSVTVMDATNNCSESLDNIVIEESYSLMTQDTFYGVSPACEGVDEGFSVVVLTGGRLPFQYNWSQGQIHLSNLPVDTLNSLAMGQYNVTITDDIGCTYISDSIALTPSDPLLISLNSVSHIACDDAENGVINVNVTGGVEPYNYNWAKVGFGYLNVNDSIISGLSNGLYYLTVTDDIGCVSNQFSYIIGTQNLPLSANSEVVAPLCNNGADGSISIVPQYYFDSYDVLWSNQSTDDTILNLVEDTYILSLTDAAGCMFLDTFILLAPPAISIDTVDITNTHCSTVNSGSVDLSISGGVGDLEYNWSNNTHNEDLNDVFPGAYVVEVVDTNNCTFISDTFYVESNWFDVNIHLDSLLNVSCYGNNDGAINLDLYSNASFEFLWSNNDTTLNTSNLYPGTYVLTITDAYGCDTISPQYFISEPAPLTVEFDITSESIPNMDGTITSIADGGTLPYRFYWDENTGNQEGSFIFGLSVGCYTVTVVDDHNCAILDTACVQDIVNNVNLINPEFIKVLPNPNKGNFKINFINIDINEIKLKIMDNIGKEYLNQIYFNQSSIEVDLQGLSSGVYYLWIETNKGNSIKKIFIK